MKRQFSFFLISVSFFALMDVSMACAQIISPGEREMDTATLRLVRVKGLQRIEEIVRDSGLSFVKSVTSFRLFNDSIWKFNYDSSDINVRSQSILFDAQNRILIEYDSMRFSKRSYCFLYDTLKRVIKKTESRQPDNSSSIDTISYSNDSIFTTHYMGGSIEDTSVKVYDKFGDLLFYMVDRVSLPEHSKTVLIHDTYDSKGRILLEGYIIPMQVPYPFRKKNTYLDSAQVERHWIYLWNDTTWNSFPTKYSEMDSLQNREIVEDFDSDGTIREIDTTYYDSYHHSLTTIRNYPKEPSSVLVEYSYGVNNELLSIISKRNNKVYRETRYHYVYSK
jgi:hypothetical protein